MDTCFFILQGVPEDLLFFYEHLRKGGGVVRVDQSLLLYRYHPGAATHSVLEYVVLGSRPGGVGVLNFFKLNLFGFQLRHILVIRRVSLSLSLSLSSLFSYAEKRWGRGHFSGGSQVQSRSNKVPGLPYGTPNLAQAQS